MPHSADLVYSEYLNFPNRHTAAGVSSCSQFKTLLIILNSSTLILNELIRKADIK